MSVARPRGGGTGRPATARASGHLLQAEAMRPGVLGPGEGRGCADGAGSEDGGAACGYRGAGAPKAEGPLRAGLGGQGGRRRGRAPRCGQAGGRGTGDDGAALARRLRFPWDTLQRSPGTPRPAALRPGAADAARPAGDQRQRRRRITCPRQGAGTECGQTGGFSLAPRPGDLICRGVWGNEAHLHSVNAPQSPSLCSERLYFLFDFYFFILELLLTPVICSLDA